jgi:hypothetical protein
MSVGIDIVLVVKKPWRSVCLMHKSNLHVTLEYLAHAAEIVSQLLRIGAIFVGRAALDFATAAHTARRHVSCRR